METATAFSRPWHRFYESGVPTEISIPPHPVHGLLGESARRFPRHQALILASFGPDFDRRITYAQLDRLAGRFAAGLGRRGLRAGDRVAISLPNLPQYVIAAYGVWKAGGVVVQVNPLYKDEELRHILNDSSARFFVGLSRLYGQVEKVLPQTSVEGVILTNLHDFFPTRFRLLYGLLRAKKHGDVLPRAPKVLSFRSVLSTAPIRAPVAVGQGDLAVLQYTGGTTGVPKAAMLSHRNLVANTLQARHWLTDLAEGGERLLSVVPFFHVYGMTICMNLSVAIAATNVMVLMPGFVARTVAAAAAKYRPTIFPGVPAMYLAIGQLKDVERYDLRSIRACVSGAAALPVEVQRRFEELTGARVVEGFGLSEASPLTHANPIYGTRKVGSIGVPITGTDARIVDVESGERVLGPDEPGEMIIRGPQVMMGYWNRPEDTAVSLRQGWLYTGDIARMDPDGFFFIEDRKKDMVNIGGLKVFPREVEEVLYQHPKVQEAAVVGVSSRVRGEMLVAHIVPRDGHDARALKRELRDWLAKRLAAYKVPRRIEIVGEIPKTIVGKALRRAIREREQTKAEEPVDDEG